MVTSAAVIEPQRLRMKVLKFTSLARHSSRLLETFLKGGKSVAIWFGHHRSYEYDHVGKRQASLSLKYIHLKLKNCRRV